jgi:hypothetical protein
MAEDLESSSGNVMRVVLKCIQITGQNRTPNLSGDGHNQLTGILISSRRIIQILFFYKEGNESELESWNAGQD